MLTRITTLLGQSPPQWERARDLLKTALLEAAVLDPLDSAWCPLADRIASTMQDPSDQLRFWNQIDRFFSTTLPRRYPSVGFRRGHSLFRRALLEIRIPGRLDTAKRLLRQAHKGD